MGRRSCRSGGVPSGRRSWSYACFGAIDHGIDELFGWHVAKLGDRWAALEPIRQGVRHAFGGYGKDVARRLAIRCDWGRSTSRTPGSRR
jgi:hypothetical protein